MSSEGYMAGKLEDMYATFVANLGSGGRQDSLEGGAAGGQGGLNNLDAAEVDLNFLYQDADEYEKEIGELYSYTEVSELRDHRAAYLASMTLWGLGANLGCEWKELGEPVKTTAIRRILNQLEMASKSMRAEALRTLLYIAQGCWHVNQTDLEQLKSSSRENVCLLIKHGVFSSVVDLLSLETDSGVHGMLPKPAVSLADSTDLRGILNVLYTIVETVRAGLEDDKANRAMGNVEAQKWPQVFKTFQAELSQPVGESEELLAIKLMNMVNAFCEGRAPHFPIKKIILLLWKVILVSLGGTPELRELKSKYRVAAGLSAQTEDTVEISRSMRTASPPSSPTDFLEGQNSFLGRKSRKGLKRSFLKQSGLDWDSGGDDTEMNDAFEGEEPDKARQLSHNSEAPASNSRPLTPSISRNRLPWTPKARVKDLDVFLDASRMKFVGYPFPGDRDTLAGLPPPIHEGVRILKEHMYVPLSEKQIKTEKDVWKYVMSSQKDREAQAPSGIESLYVAMLPNLKHYIVALLKVLLASCPISKNHSESINILAEMLPEEMPMTVELSTRLGMDVARHKEIIVKNVSGILLLLLKHTKINHVYQFECISQALVYGNCIPLVLKFFNQSRNVNSYIMARNVIPENEYPACVLGQQVELAPENLEGGNPEQQFSWRNLFTAINLLRILNKLAKCKQTRIMMMVVFKSAPILKRSLKVRHPLFQLYVLKLLKMQTKYLGRQWRKANMVTMSAIYQNVRHWLTDDWAYGNDVEARPWDFHEEEKALRDAVELFNIRKYANTSQVPSEFEPMDQCIESVLGEPVQLTNTFKQNYEVWMEEEVFKNPVNWNEVLEYRGVM